MDEIVLSVHVARANFNISFYLFGSQIYQRVPIIQIILRKARIIWKIAF